MEADTLIELKTTDVDGKISFIADLPIDGTYYVKELYAPDGFVTTGEEQEFVFEYQGDKEAEVSYEFVFEDEPTTVELSKTDLTTGEELPGARLQLTDENGAVVEEWTSTKEPHIIKELVVGKSYTLTETKPADGYAQKAKKSHFHFVEEHCREQERGGEGGEAERRKANKIQRKKETGTKTTNTMKKAIS